MPTALAHRYSVRDSLADDGLGRVRLIVVMTEEERKLRIAYAIRTARERQGLTPPELADRVGRTRGTINDWEANRSTPSLVDLGPLCVALGVDPKLFAELPAKPTDPLAEYFVAEADSGAREGLRRTRRRRGGTAS